MTPIFDWLDAPGRDLAAAVVAALGLAVAAARVYLVARGWGDGGDPPEGGPADVSGWGTGPRGP